MPITDYGVKAALGKAINATTPQSDKLAALAVYEPSELPAGSAEKFDFLGAVSAMREWIGARQPGKPIEYVYSVTLKKFEVSTVLPLDWINNDKSTQVQRRLTQMSARYMPQWPAKLIAGLINAGATDLCFDGKAFFANDHVWGDSGTIDNLLEFNAAVADAPTANEAADAIVAAVTSMSGYKDDKGEPINEGMTKITIVTKAGTAISSAVHLAITEKNLDTGTGVRSNPVMGLGLQIDHIASVRITVDRMICVNSSPEAVPFAFVENKTDHNRTMKGPGSDFEHDNDAWEVGIKAVGVAGYGLFVHANSTQFT